MHEEPLEDEPESRFIVTDRLLLKPPGDAGREAVIALARHPGIADNLATAPSEYQDKGGRTFVVTNRKTRSTVGVSGFGPMADPPEAIEVATWIGDPYWGRGYATEATQAVIDYAFGETGVAALWCANRMSNTRARRVVEKCGFQFRGVGMTRSSVTHAALPVERFVLERRTWQSLKAWGANQRTFHDDRREGESHADRHRPRCSSDHSHAHSLA